MFNFIFFFFFLRCPNLAVKEAEDDENIEEEDVPVEKVKKVLQTKKKRQTQSKLAWIGEPIEVAFLYIQNKFGSSVFLGEICFYPGCWFMIMKGCNTHFGQQRAAMLKSKCMQLQAGDG